MTESLPWLRRWAAKLERGVEVLVLKPSQRIQIAGQEHQDKPRKNEPHPRNNPADPTRGQAAEENAQFGGPRPGKDLVDGEDSLEAWEGDPLVLDHELVLDQGDLRDGATPSEEAEVVEEELEELQIG